MTPIQHTKGPLSLIRDKEYEIQCGYPNSLSVCDNMNLNSGATVFMFVLDRYTIHKDLVECARCYLFPSMNCSSLLAFCCCD